MPIILSLIFLAPSLHLFVVSKDPRPPLRQIDPAPNGSDLGHYMKSSKIEFT